MSPLPSEWQKVSLAEVADCRLGKMLDRSKHTTGVLLPYLRNQNVRWGHFQLDDLSEMFFEKDKLDRYAVQSGDVIVCEGGEPGRAAVWTGELAGVKYQKALHRVRPNGDELSPYWLVHCLKNDSNSGVLQRYFSGSTIKHFTGKALSTYRVPVPPLETQHRIVEKLDAIHERTRAAREALEAIPPLVERFRQSVLAAAFRGDLTADWRAKNPDVEPASELLKRTDTPPRPARWGKRTMEYRAGDFALCVSAPSDWPSPESWSWVPLLDVARLESGHTPSRRREDWWGGSIPWVGIKDARRHHGVAIHETLANTNDEGLANSAARLLPAGTVCLSRTASVGYVTRLGTEMATSQDFANFVCTDAVDPEWLQFLLMAESQALRRFAKGSTHQTIYYPELLSLHVALPPIEEQREIVRRVQARLGQSERFVELVEPQASHLLQLERSALAKAFRGELVS